MSEHYAIRLTRGTGKALWFGSFAEPLVCRGCRRVFSTAEEAARVARAVRALAQACGHARAGAQVVAVGSEQDED